MSSSLIKAHCIIRSSNELIALLRTCGELPRLPIRPLEGEGGVREVSVIVSDVVGVRSPETMEPKAHLAKPLLPDL